jgi:hypothetical protein
VSFSDHSEDVPHEVVFSPVCRFWVASAGVSDVGHGVLEADDVIEIVQAHGRFHQ